MKGSRGLTSKLSPFALRLLNWLLVLTLILPWLVGVGHASTSTEIVVNTTEDVKKGNDGRCSLREAIIAANSDKQSSGKPGECAAGSNTGTDIIYLRIFGPETTYILSRTDNGNEDAASTGDLDVFGDVIIMPEPEPAVPGVVTIDASGITDRAFQILSGNVTIEGVTITKNGGVVAGDGGGLRNSGNLTLANSTLSDNHTAARGGGIYNAGLLTLKGSTIGGKGTTVGERGNTAGDSGGAIANASSGSVTLNNSTVSGNSAPNGGGIYNTGILELHNATIANNSGRGVVNSDASGTVSFRNTIIAENSPTDCAGTLSSQGYNLASDSSCGLNVDHPLLGPLQDNGGQTETHALLAGSPAIDAGDPSGCFGSDGLLTTDQRGEPRPMDGDHDRDFRCDIGAFEIGGTTLILTRAKADGTIDGRIGSAANTTFTLEFFATDSCPTGFGPVDGATFLAPTPDPNQPIQVQTDEYGNVYFTATATPPGATFVYGQATVLNGSTSTFSQCVPVGPGNTSWPNALSLDDATDYPLTGWIDQYIDKLGQSRWYKFSVQPNSKVIVTLTGEDGGPLPANYDLTIYKDIVATFLDLINPQDNSDLVRLGAEFAGEAFSGEAFSGEAFSSDAFSGEAFSGEAFSGEAFSGEAFSGEAFSGEAFSGEAFSSDAFSGEAFSGEAFSGEAFSGEAFSGEAFSGEAFSGEAFSGEAFSDQAYNAVFSSAQTRSLLGVSAFEGTASEGIRVSTWNNTGEFYVRVRGRNGAFSLDAPFRLTVTLEPGSCGDIAPLPDTSPIGTGGDKPKTLILYDRSRLNLIEGSDEIDLETQLTNLASHPEVEGKVLDVSDDARVNFANSQADANPTCPYAKNLVVQAIKDIIDGYRTQDGSILEYVVLVGGDEAIPSARVPDDALLANEQNYYPPVRDNTASQASLRLGYVLTQDVYGSEVDISLHNSVFPVPGLAVGRLVETAAEINAVIEAFLYHTDNGVVTPQTSLATGYDFLYDAATEIQAELKGGIGGDDTASPALLTAGGGPGDPDAWTAYDLRQELRLDTDEEGPDIVFLAGHFTGNSALAADYDTRLLASEVADSSVDLTGSVLFSIGCHAGYNIVNQHDIPNVTREPDWAQAFARHGATLVGGTGYQYGDTDLLRYSEELYLEFILQLRLQSAPGPVSIGQALVEAKKAYLIRTPHIGGLDEKALLEATIFGLPMLKVDLIRDYVPTDPPTLPDLDPTLFITNPGLELGLEYDDVTVVSPDPLIEHQQVLRDVETGLPLDEPASYLEGFNGFDANPAEPILPLEVRDVTVGGTVLRGVGFRGGVYEEVDILPLISSATTENSGIHTPFLTDFLYPIQTWGANYFDALGGGKTLLMVTPAQHRTSTIFGDPQKSTRRQFSEMTFRLYYSNNTTTFAGDPDHPSTPAVSAPPAIINVSDVVSGTEVTFNVTVVGNPSAGIQEVWITYAVCDPDELPRSGEWKPLDLDQDAADSTLWEATRTLDQLGVENLTDDNICYMVQAVNGVGLVSRADNLGQFFRVGVDVEPAVATNLTFLSPPPYSSSPFGTKADFSAKLTDENGQTLDDQIVTFRLGGQTRRAKTDSSGIAGVKLALIGEPGDTEVKVSFAGAGPYKPSDATLPFTISEQGTYFVLDPDPAEGLPDDPKLITATLKTVDDRPLFEKTVVFEVTGSGGTYTEAAITNFAGRAFLGNLPLPRGEYAVDVSFDDPLITGLEDDPLYTSSSETGSLTLLNTPPVAEDDTYSIHKFELTVDSGVLDNDSDRDGDPLTAILATPPTSGTVALNPDGSFTYLPGADFDSLDETDTFTYRAHDGFDASDEVATVTIVPSLCFTAKAIIVADPTAPSIWPPNGELIPVDVTIDSTASISITGIFQDEPVGSTGPDGLFIDANALEVRAERDGGGNGRVYHILFTALDGQGDIICQGDVRLPVVSHDQSGRIDEFDGGALYDSTETPKFAPVANDDPFTTDEDMPVTDNVLANDTDKNNDPLTAIKVSDPANGTVTLNPDGIFTYTPNADFSGTDSFTYKASDGELESNVATVTITVNSVNDPPVANPDVGTTVQDLAVTIGVLDNDTDVDGDTLTITAFDPTSFHGGGVDCSDGQQCTYTPPSGFVGTDSFTYTISDGNGGTATATVSVTVNAANSAPDAVDDQNSTDEDTALSVGAANGVLNNDTDDDFDPLTVTAVNGQALVGSQVTLPSGALLTLNADGSYVYDPNGQFDNLAVGAQAPDTFTYEVSDGNGGTDTATVTITIDGVNDAPVANDDSATTDENTVVTIDVLDNDEDVDGDTLTITAFDPTSVNGGDVDCSDGQQCTYTPPTDFIDTDSFTYTISDGNGGTDTATVTVTINPTNDPPDAVDDSSETAPQGTPVTIYVLVNDSDPNDDPLTVIDFTQPARGTVVADTEDGQQILIYTPNSHFKGTDTFTYTISDGRGGTDTATVTVTFSGKESGG